METGPRYDTISLVEIDRTRLNAVPDRLHPVILVVDDEAVIADTLAAILRKQNYSVLVAYDAESAFDLVSVIPPELLISDVVMPGMSGVELAIKVKNSVPDCQVLLFSGQSTSLNLLADARAAGHDFVLLDKPIHPKDLLAQITSLGLGVEIAAEAC